uniref:Phytochrome n=2 Tax=Stellaria longipes TaxID=19744 RepID=Q717V6_STELP|nr:phytochrome C [Stellaria longipes]
MSSSTSRNSSVRSRHDAHVVIQTPVDAQLASDFEQSERVFNYTSSVDLNLLASSSDVPSSTVKSYLQKVQRGGLIQSFGCLIAIDEKNFKVIAYSENAPEMLDLTPHTVPNIEQLEALTFGTDVATLFTSSGVSALQKAVNYSELNLLNPILVHSKNSGKPFYAILHRIKVGLVLDLETVNLAETLVGVSGALMSYKLAAKAISKLQSLPSQNIPLLCDVLVKEVRELTGYDRVMVYKFHDDQHGEVIGESHSPSLDSYLGLHYPATDIPQASRFLFLKNKVRMICDCRSPSVKVIQDEALTQPLSLGGSTLRAPHGCHAQYMANMGSIASLVMAVTINNEEDEVSDRHRTRKLWGLVVCHHTSSRFVPYPLRYACEFLVQVFGIHINKEVELAAQVREKHILKIQSMLCDMLMRDSPITIITQSPNVMDLVKCDGAALLYQSKLWVLGITPKSNQIKDISQWLFEYHGNTKGLITDSLKEAGYPGALELGDAVCGMAAVRISSEEMLFWFRSHTAKEIKWGGAKHEPGQNDERGIMHPRSSFNAFLDVVKWRSVPWEDMEMDSIYSLQLIFIKCLVKNKTMSDTSKMIVNVPGVGVGGPLSSALKVEPLTGEVIRLIETAAVPIFSVDVTGAINGWNFKVAELTGVPMEQVIGSQLVDVVVEGTVEVLKNILSSALQGTEEKNVEIRLRTLGSHGKTSYVVLVVNACCSRDVDENVTGICFVGQDVTEEKRIVDQITELQGDYSGIMRNPCHLIPPIFLIDDQGVGLEWNDAMAKISGLSKEYTVGRMLIGEVFTNGNDGCQVKDYETLLRLKIFLSKMIDGEESDKVLFGFFDHRKKCIDALLCATPRFNADRNITGVLCFLHLPSPELQYSIHMQKVSEKAATSTLKKLTYFREQVRSPIKGMAFTRNLLESSELNIEQKQILTTISLCESQLMKIIEDTDIPSIEEGYLETSSDDFNLLEALDAVVSQVMPLSQESQVHIKHDFPSDLSPVCLFGDNVRLQQILSNFLTIAVRFTPPSTGSSVKFAVSSRTEHVGSKMQMFHVEFRITHPLPGVPENLIREMFQRSPGMSRGGLSLYISHKLVKIMNGTLQYLRGEDYSSFIVFLEFPVA